MCLSVFTGWTRATRVRRGYWPGTSHRQACGRGASGTVEAGKQAAGGNNGFRAVSLINSPFTERKALGATVLTVLLMLF